MNYANIEPWQRSKMLERAVLKKTPAEVSGVLQALGKTEFTARVLGLACRYRGLEMTNVLVQHGANFQCPEEWNVDKAVVNAYRGNDPDYSLLLFDNTVFVEGIHRPEIELKILPMSERLRILEYLLDNAEKVGLVPEKLLYFSICWEGTEIYELLKSRDISLSNNTKRRYVFNFSANDYTPIGSYRLAVREIGLELFDKYSKSKINLLRYLIDNDAADCLAELENYGWFKAPKKRDELIQYASGHGKTECAAWLLEYKNRTADLAAERAKAEKKLEREFNAAPDSVTELKKIWKYEKREDGTIIITGYKGVRTDIVVPEKIGKSPVTAIGEYAFSPNAPRLTEEKALVRCRITKITVPPSVRIIGKYAFGGAGCVAGNFNAFSLLEEVILPDSLEIFADKKAAENAPIIFVNCPKLTVKIPHSPYAEVFCRRNKVNYTFSEVNT